MAWYAYCIGEKQAFPELARHRKPVPLESVMGVSGNQVFLYPASDLALIVSEHNPEEQYDQKAGVDHARVIADCFKLSTVLPFRFGTVFNDDEALRRSIRSNQRCGGPQQWWLGDQSARISVSFWRIWSVCAEKRKCI